MKILVMNAGSSSQKACLYEQRSDGLSSQPLWRASIDWVGQPGVANIKVTTQSGGQLHTTWPLTSRLQVLTQVLATLWQGDDATALTPVLDHPNQIDAVGHRVVHGGPDYRQSVRITAEVKAAIARLAPLAPAHNPASLEGIEMLEQILDLQIPQIAVFDTAFHRSIPDAAAIYPGPYAWVEQGIRRYGFHGINHQYCAQRAAQLLNRELQDLRLITCHLGNGCSLAAVRHGHSIDTTMGFTPLDGLMMGSRSGAVDPGILIHLLRQPDYTLDRLTQELNQASGLIGISGISADLRAVLAAIAVGNPRAELALDIYLHRLGSCLGSMLVSLGGLDGLVFTAGIGENSPIVRERACQALEFLGLKLDLEKNRQPSADSGLLDCKLLDRDIATADSKIRVLVIQAEEDWAIAQSCSDYINSLNTN